MFPLEIRPTTVVSSADLTVVLLLLDWAAVTGVETGHKLVVSVLVEQRWESSLTVWCLLVKKSSIQVQGWRPRMPSLVI